MTARRPYRPGFIREPHPSAPQDPDRYRARPRKHAPTRLQDRQPFTETTLDDVVRGSSRQPTETASSKRSA